MVLGLGPVTALAVRALYLWCGVECFKAIDGAGAAARGLASPLLTHWGALWLALAAAELLFTCAWPILFFVPFSNELRLASLLWLSPAGGGADVVYRRLLVPYLKKTDGELQLPPVPRAVSENAKTVAKAAGRALEPAVRVASVLLEESGMHPANEDARSAESNGDDAEMSPVVRVGGGTPVAHAKPSILAKIVHAVTEHEQKLVKEMDAPSPLPSPYNKGEEVIALAAAGVGFAAAVAEEHEPTDADEGDDAMIDPDAGAAVATTPVTAAA
jgi:hypothetical protein